MTDDNKDDSSSSSSVGSGSDNRNNINNDKKDRTSKKRIQALEAKAVAEATATADAQYVPSISLMNSNDPLAFLGQVDGLSICQITKKKNRYTLVEVYQLQPVAA